MERKNRRTGPTLYAEHPDITKVWTKKGLNGVGLTGPKPGIMEIDDVTIRSVKSEINPRWDAVRNTFLNFETVVIRE